MRNRKMRKKLSRAKEREGNNIKYMLGVVQTVGVRKKKCKINKMNEITNQNYVLPEHAQCLRLKFESNIEQHEPNKKNLLTYMTLQRQGYQKEMNTKRNTKKNYQERQALSTLRVPSKGYAHIRQQQQKLLYFLFHNS